MSTTTRTLRKPAKSDTIPGRTSIGIDSTNWLDTGRMPSAAVDKIGGKYPWRLRIWASSHTSADRTDDFSTKAEALDVARTLLGAFVTEYADTETIGDRYAYYFVANRYHQVAREVAEIHYERTIAKYRASIAR